MMSYAEQILPEFDAEMGNTRKVLENVPNDKLDWRAHPALNTIGWNANHLAEIVGWVEGTLTQPNWDIAPPDGEAYQSPALKTTAEILSLFDQNVAAARQALASVPEEKLTEMWSLLSAGQPLFTLPRAAVIRTFMLNHLIHHRAHLCVYLRLNDVELPGMYGPG